MVRVQNFTEMFSQEGENDKSLEDFYTFSRATVKFQRSDVPVEGLPLLEKVLSKHPDFMSNCTYGNTVRKVMFQSLAAVLLDMEHTTIKSSNLHKVLFFFFPFTWVEEYTQWIAIHEVWCQVYSWLASSYGWIMHYSWWWDGVGWPCGENCNLREKNCSKVSGTFFFNQSKGFHCTVLIHQRWLFLNGDLWQRLVGLSYPCLSLLY